MSLWRQTGNQPEALKRAPKLSPLVSHLWAWFVDLNSERGNNGMQAMRITSGMMKDWCWATGNNPALWERTALRRLDARWMREVAK